MYKLRSYIITNLFQFVKDTLIMHSSELGSGRWIGKF